MVSEDILDVKLQGIRKDDGSAVEEYVYKKLQKCQDKRFSGRLELACLLSSSRDEFEAK